MLGRGGGDVCVFGCFPAGLTKLALADVSGPSGALHKHCILTDFLQQEGKKDNVIFLLDHDDICLFGTRVHARTPYASV